jgi:hypothetical protein
MSYNGWTNYETWVVNLWIDNDEYLYNDRLDLVREGKFRNEMHCGEAIRDWLREVLEDTGKWPQTGLVADLFGAAWEAVNWTEIGEHSMADLADSGGE